MKKIISVLLALSVLMSAFCISSFAVDIPVGTSQNSSIYLKLVSFTEGEEIVYDLCVNDASGIGIASGGFYVDYPSMLSLKSCERVFASGFFITSQSLEENPFHILWVLGTDVLPFEEVVIARLTFGFNYVPEADEEISVGMGCDPDNAPTNIDGDVVEEEEIEVDPDLSYTYEEIVTMPEISIKSYFEFECVKQAGNELVLDMYLSCDEGLDMSGFEVLLSYPQGFKLKSSEKMLDGGSLIFSDRLDKVPYVTAAALGTSAFPQEKTCIARYTFEIDDSVEKLDVSEIKLSVDEAVSLDGNNITIKVSAKNYGFDPASALKSITVSSLPDMVKYISADKTFEFEGGKIDAEYWDGSVVEGIALSDCTVSDYTRNGKTVCLLIEYNGCLTELTAESDLTPGDVNGDGKVSILDANLTLQYIAKWDVNVDPKIADVNGDGKVTLFDVNLMLKYIARWNVTLN